MITFNRYIKDCTFTLSLSTFGHNYWFFKHYSLWCICSSFSRMDNSGGSSSTCNLLHTAWHGICPFRTFVWQVLQMYWFSWNDLKSVNSSCWVLYICFFFYWITVFLYSVLLQTELIYYRPSLILVWKVVILWSKSCWPEFL